MRRAASPTSCRWLRSPVLPHLNLKRNEIGDISALASLTNLHQAEPALEPDQRHLAAGRPDQPHRARPGGANEISDISPLAALTNLTELVLLQNQITDVSPLLENTGLSEGDSINLAQNQFDEDGGGRRHQGNSKSAECWSNSSGSTSTSTS